MPYEAAPSYIRSVCGCISANSAATEIMNTGLILSSSGIRNALTARYAVHPGRPARGSSFRNSANVFRRSFCSPIRSCGVSTWMRARRSPLPDAPSLGAPLPLIFKSLPSWVPAGTFRLTLPSGVGTRTVAPSAASTMVTGTWITKSQPRRSKTGLSSTSVTTYRSPGGPPRTPGSPLPYSRILVPSLAPAGMGTELRITRGAGTPQVGQGSRSRYRCATTQQAWLSEETLTLADHAPTLALRTAIGEVPGAAPPPRILHCALPGTRICGHAFE